MGWPTAMVLITMLVCVTVVSIGLIEGRRKKGE